jgi:hypothetical protein
MDVNYDDSLTNIVNSYIGKESLCMLLLASSILFYDMAKKHNNNIPRIYTLTISILLIVYSAILGIHSGYEFLIQINDTISKCVKQKCDVNLEYYNNIKNFYISMGIIYAFILVLITYVLIRYDK